VQAPGADEEENGTRLTAQVKQVISRNYSKRETGHPFSDNYRTAVQRNQPELQQRGTIGKSDAELLVQLNEERGKPTSG